MYICFQKDTLVYWNELEQTPLENHRQLEDSLELSHSELPHIKWNASLSLKILEGIFSKLFKPAYDPQKTRQNFQDLFYCI